MGNHIKNYPSALMLRNSMASRSGSEVPAMHQSGATSPNTAHGVTCPRRVQMSTSSNILHQTPISGLDLILVERHSLYKIRYPPTHTYMYL